MATDIRAVIDHLAHFYSFADKKVISVGAGGGQLIEYGRKSRKVWAVDCDPQALATLKKRLQEARLEKIYTPVLCDFHAFDQQADMVIFEFCLHEIPDPENALRHALRLAPEAVIIDHFPGSPWAFLVAEDVKVKISWQAIRRFPIRAEKTVETVQRFNDYDELYQKVKSQGETSIRRIEPYRIRRDFTVPMTYGMALL